MAMPNWFQDFEKEHSIEIKCPVCKNILGMRNGKEPFEVHCSDCKAVYTFLNAKKPKAKLDSQIRHECACDACKDRDKTRP